MNLCYVVMTVSLITQVSAVVIAYKKLVRRVDDSTSTLHDAIMASRDGVDASHDLGLGSRLQALQKMRFSPSTFKRNTQR